MGIFILCRMENIMANLLLGIDIGTYSSKGVLCKPDGTLIDSAKVEHKMSIPKPGYAEQDAEDIWWADFVYLSRKLNSKLSKNHRIVSAAVSAIGPCLLPVDEKGQPLRQGILYGVDTRASKQIRFLENKIGLKNLLELGGMQLTSQAVGPKILWIKENEPSVYKKASHFLTASSYIIYKLTGKYVIDYHTASHFNPFFNINEYRWDLRHADGLVTINQLPELGWSDNIAGELSHKASEETTLPAGIPITYGAVDALSEAISVGVVETGDLMLMYGSTAFLISIINNPNKTKRIWITAGAFKGQYNLAAGLSTSGSIMTWFRDQFSQDLLMNNSINQINPFEKLAEEAIESNVGSNGLIFLPYMSGERTPIHDPKARGVIIGLALNHNRGDVYRSIIEGTSFAIRHNLEAMSDMGASIDKAVAVGGGTSNKLWLQTVSDISGIKQLVPKKTIGASYGNAFLAGLASEYIKDISSLKNEWVNYIEEISPIKENNKSYEKLYSLFIETYKSTKPLVHNLVDSHQ